VHSRVANSIGLPPFAFVACLAIIAFGVDVRSIAASDSGNPMTQSSDNSARFSKVEDAYSAEFDGITANVYSVSKVPSDIRRIFTRCESQGAGKPIRVRCVMYPNPFSPRTAPAIAFIDSAASGYTIQLYRDEDLVAAYSLDNLVAGEYFISFSGPKGKCGEYSLTLSGDDQTNCRCDHVNVECSETP
jgi:hypothetical protein